MSVIERTIQVSFQHRVYFTRASVFGLDNPLLKEVLGGTSTSRPKAFVVVDESCTARNRA